MSLIERDTICLDWQTNLPSLCSCLLTFCSTFARNKAFAVDQQEMTDPGRHKADDQVINHLIMSHLIRRRKGVLTGYVFPH